MPRRTTTSSSAAGSALHAGKFLAANLEGLSVAAAVPEQALLLVSSQGHSSFHFYRIGLTQFEYLSILDVLKALAGSALR